MANRRMLTAGQTLARAAWLVHWLVHGLEVLAHRCLHALRIGSGHVLTKARPAGAHAGFASHSLQHQRRRAPWRPRSPARARDAGPVAQSSRSADGPLPKDRPVMPDASRRCRYGGSSARCDRLCRRPGPVELLRRGFDLTLVRAFDPVPDIAPAIELAADLGFRRILTSVQAATAAEGRAGLER